MTVAIVGDIHFQETNPRSRKDHYFQSNLDELSSIIEENDIIMLLGDVFERPTIAVRELAQLFSVLSSYKARGKQFYTIVGNHDIFNYAESTLERTALGFLNTIGVLPILEQVEIEGVTFVREPCTAKVTIQPSPKSPSVLLAHYFFEVGISEERQDPEYTLSSDMVAGAGYDYVFLGHDHELYDPVQIGKTWVLRPGALARNTAHGFNLRRVPDYYQMVINKGTIESCTLKPIPAAKNSRELFHDLCFEKPSENINIATAVNVDTVIGELTTQQIGNLQSVRDILIKLQCSGDVFDYLRAVFDRLNFAFD